LKEILCFYQSIKKLPLKKRNLFGIEPGVGVPKDWDTITALGIIYEDKGEDAKASQMLQQAVALNPNHPDKVKLSKPGQKFNFRND
jgi:hypothetical protein